MLFPEGVLYQHVRAEDVAEIVEKTVLGGEMVERLFYVDPTTDVQYRKEEEIPFYRHQQRLVLRDNGHLDPTSIDDYIALGGYSALARALEMGSDGGPRGGQARRPARSRRRRLPGGQEVGGVPQCPG